MKIKLISVIPAIVWLAISCPAATHYVSLSGTNNSPYTNWADAATQIQWAVNSATAGDTVLVSNGTYYLTNQINITATITCQSVNGREVTIVDGNNYVGKSVTNRCFYLSGGSNCVVDGFTIQNGYSTNTGGGVYIITPYCLIKNCKITGNICTDFGGGIYSYGTVSNCEISGNQIPATYPTVLHGGGGVAMRSSGSLVNSIVSNNIIDWVTNSTEKYGGGVYVQSPASGGMIDRCIISGNTNVNGTGYTGWGGGVCFSQRGGLIRNSFLHHNVAGYLGGGILEYASSDMTIQNCTVVSNTSHGGGGGIAVLANYGYTSKVENTICYFNVSSNANVSNLNIIATGVYSGKFSVVNSCVSTTNNGSVFPVNGNQFYSNNIAVNPQFVNKDTCNFRLAQGSPCINTGTNQGWMTGAVDLDGRLRIDRFSGVVDMGTYEYLPQGIMFSVP